MNLVSVPLEGLDSTPQTKGHASELEQSKRCNYSHLGNVCWLQGDVTVCSHEVYPERWCGSGLDSPHRVTSPPESSKEPCATEKPSNSKMGGWWLELTFDWTLGERSWATQEAASTGRRQLEGQWWVAVCFTGWSGGGWWSLHTRTIWPSRSNLACRKWPCWSLPPPLYSS